MQLKNESNTLTIYVHKLPVNYWTLISSVAVLVSVVLVTMTQ